MSEACDFNCTTNSPIDIYLLSFRLETLYNFLTVFLCQNDMLLILYKKQKLKSYNWLSDLISYRVVTKQTYITSKQHHKIPEIKGNGRNGSSMVYERGMKERKWKKVNIKYTGLKRTLVSIL